MCDYPAMDGPGGHLMTCHTIYILHYLTQQRWKGLQKASLVSCKVSTSFMLLSCCSIVLPLMYDCCVRKSFLNSPAYWTSDIPLPSSHPTLLADSRDDTAIFNACFSISVPQSTREWPIAILRSKPGTEGSPQGTIAGKSQENHQTPENPNRKNKDRALTISPVSHQMIQTNQLIEFALNFVMCTTGNFHKYTFLQTGPVGTFACCCCWQMNWYKRVCLPVCDHSVNPDQLFGELIGSIESGFHVWASIWYIQVWYRKSGSWQVQIDGWIYCVCIYGDIYLCKPATNRSSCRWVEGEGAQWCLLFWLLPMCIHKYSHNQKGVFSVSMKVGMQKFLQCFTLPAI